MTTEFASMIPPRARRALEEQARAAGRSLEEHIAIVGDGRPSVSPSERQGPPLTARVVDVFNVLDLAGDVGMTDLEIAAELDGLDARAVEVCRRELLKDELVHDTGRRLKTSFGLAVVWALTPKGRELLR